MDAIPTTHIQTEQESPSLHLSTANVPRPYHPAAGALLACLPHEIPSIGGIS